MEQSVFVHAESSLMPPPPANGNDTLECDSLLVMWTKQEDEILRDQVKVHGIDNLLNFVEVCKRAEDGRLRVDRADHIDLLCGDFSDGIILGRWHMFLNVVTKRGGWIADEDRLLLEAHKKFGNRWTEIARNLPGRTDNAVKNRFSVLCKRQTKAAGLSLVQRHPAVSKQKLRERRCCEGLKSIHDQQGVKEVPNVSGRAPMVASQQTPPEETPQKFKELRRSEVVTNTTLRQESNERLQQWDTLQSYGVVHNKMLSAGLLRWTQLSLEKERSGAHQQRQRRSQEWEASPSTTATSPRVSRQGQSNELNVLQSQQTSISSSSCSRVTEDNLQQWKLTPGEPSTELMHQRTVLQKRHLTWCGRTTTNTLDKVLTQQKPASEMLGWWKGTPTNIQSDYPLAQMDVEEAFHWRQTSQVSVTASCNHQGSADGNLQRRVGEMNSLVTVYMSSSKQSTLVGGLQRWPGRPCGEHREHMQQSNAPEAQVWDNSPAKEVSGNIATLPTYIDNTKQRQVCNSTQARNQLSCKRRISDHNIPVDQLNFENCATSTALQQGYAKRLQLCTSAIQQATESTISQDRDERETPQSEQSTSERTINSSHCPLEDEDHPWDKSAVMDERVRVSVLNHFAGRETQARPGCLSGCPQQPRRHQAQLNEDSPRTKLSRIKCASTLFTADAEIQNPRDVLGVEDYAPGILADIDRKRLTVSSPSTTPPRRGSWEVRTDGKVKTERPTAVPGETRSDFQDVLTDAAHSPTQISRSHLTLESMPSPQFSDSEKDFLLRTLDPPASSWSASPAGSHSRSGRVRNPLIDVRHDTPARSPLSSRLLRQFQDSETSGLA